MGICYKICTQVTAPVPHRLGCVRVLFLGAYKLECFGTGLVGSQHGLAVRKVSEKEVIKQNLTFKLQNKRRPVIFGCAAGGSGVVAEGKKTLNVC